MARTRKPLRRRRDLLRQGAGDTAHSYGSTAGGAPSVRPRRGARRSRFSIGTCRASSPSRPAAATPAPGPTTTVGERAAWWRDVVMPAPKSSAAAGPLAPATIVIYRQAVAEIVEGRVDPARRAHDRTRRAVSPRARRRRQGVELTTPARARVESNPRRMRPANTCGGTSPAAQVAGRRSRAGRAELSRPRSVAPHRRDARGCECEHLFALALRTGAPRRAPRSHLGRRRPRRRDDANRTGSPQTGRRRVGDRGDQNRERAHGAPRRGGDRHAAGPRPRAKGRPARREGLA